MSTTCHAIIIETSQLNALRCRETLDELIALRKLKRATGGIDLERLNAGERKKKRKVTVNEDGSRVTEDGMIEGTEGGIKGKDRVRDEVDE